jgi:hypothetical protein
MAIASEFIDFIVPIKLIEQKYPGGWEQCLEDHKDLIGGRVWYDEHLFRDGAMNPMDIECLVNDWTDLGFQCTTEINGQKTWHDVCVFEGMFGGATLPCDWIEFDAATRSAYLKGTPIGDLKCRDSYC